MFGNVKYVGQSLVEVLVRQKPLALSLTVFASTRFWQSVTTVLCGYQKWHPNPPPPPHSLSGLFFDLMTTVLKKNRELILI
jgi:hypothetical protein